jgi:hypothetical protein
MIVAIKYDEDKYIITSAIRLPNNQVQLDQDIIEEYIDIIDVLDIFHVENMSIKLQMFQAILEDDIGSAANAIVDGITVAWKDRLQYAEDSQKEYTDDYSIQLKYYTKCFNEVIHSILRQYNYKPQNLIYVKD